jgi:hypothetical protein
VSRSGIERDRRGDERPEMIDRARVTEKVD